jgi:hypothetical protein
MVRIWAFGLASMDGWFDTRPWIAVVRCSETCGPLDWLLAAAAQESAEHVAKPAAHRRVDDPSIEMPCAALMAKV